MTKPFAVQEAVDIAHAVLQVTSVLVVDDREVERRLLQAVLEDAGYVVGEASGGVDAVAKAKERHYDIVLMDVRMPDMDGFSAFQAIVAADPRAKGIFITGHSLEGLEREVFLTEMLTGALTVVTKPVDPGKMLALMSDL